MVGVGAMFELVMKHTLLTLTLLSAAAGLSAQSAGSPNMSYDFVRLGYAQTKELDGLTVSASALLGDHIIVGGEFQDVEGRKFNASGEATSFLLGARFGVGSGDIIISGSYGQLQGVAVDGATVGLLAGNVKSIGVTYRHSFNETWEAFVGLSRIRTEVAAGSFDLDSGDFGVGASSTSDTSFSVAVRCNLSKEFDITAGHSWIDGQGGWSLSVGYNF